MKYLISCMLSAICSIPLLFAEDNKTLPGKYSVIGYNGKDTIHIGVVTPNEKGNLTISLGDYRGSIKLTSLSPEFKEIKQHYNQISQINSEEAFNRAKAYITDSLSFTNLYHSGLWQDYIQHWVGFYAQTSKTPDEFAGRFLPVAKQVIDRTTASDSKTTSFLVHDLIEFFEQFGLDKAAKEIAAYSFGLELRDGEHNAIASRLLVTARIMQQQAPSIAGIDNLQSSILIFYETGCGNCDKQIEAFKTNYEELVKKGYRVISISADNSKEVHKFSSDSFPWADKLCDFKGFDGENFRNYGVAGTPTIYVIDKMGIVQGRYARLVDTGALN